MTVMIFIVLVVLGLALGSFVNALVWRLHEQEHAASNIKPSKRRIRKLKPEDLSILKGRSMCTVCHHELSAGDLVPVVSWVLLKGKCRYCSAPISLQYPAVELLTASLFVASYLLWSHGFSPAGIFDFSLWLVFSTGFMALAVYDLRWFLLPDRIVFPLIGIAVMKLIADEFIFGGGASGAWMVALALACTAGLFYTLYLISKGRWIGFGDVKLAIVLGILAAGPAQALLLVFVSAFLGTLAAVPFLFRGRVSVKSQIPFGPFLISATFIVVLLGDRIITWYGHLMGIR